MAHIFIMSIISAIGVDNNDENHFNRLDVMIQLWAVLFIWYLGFVESFITTVYTIPWAYDATLIALTILYLVCGVFGTTFLHKKSVVLGFRYVAILFLPGCGGPMIWKIYQAKKSGDTNLPSFKNMWLSMQPFVFTAVLITTWYLGCDYSGNYRIVCFISGTMFANISSRMIIIKMSGVMPGVSHYCNVLLGVVGLGLVLDGAFRFFLEQEMAVKVSEGLFCGVLGIVLVVHLGYSVDVIRRLSDFLGIYAFSVKDRKKSIEGSLVN